MLSRALDAGVPARWVTADEAYGQDSKFRAFCDLAHAHLAVTAAIDPEQ